MELIDLARRSLLVGIGALAATRVFAQSNRAVRIAVSYTHLTLPTTPYV